MPITNYYDVLGVSQNADDKEIKSAYMKLSLKHHPDRNPDNVEESTRLFQQINEAYDTLKDNGLRKKHDHELKYGEGSPFFGGGMNGDMDTEIHDINNIFNMMFSGMPGFGGGGMRGGFPMGGGAFSMGGMPGGVHVFHMGPEHILQQMQKPPPIIRNIELTLELAYFGGNYTFDLEKTIVKDGMQMTEIDTVHVNIPQGITNNEIIVLRNRGHMLTEGVSGDVKLCILILENMVFRRAENDLIYLKKLTLKEALCGFAMEIKHLNGKMLNMNNLVNPTIIKPGYKKVVQNMGMIRNDQSGNLIIEFEIEFPDKLSEQQIEVLKQIL